MGRRSVDGRMADSVRVTAADFNGSTWDGAPFEPMEPWLAHAARAGQIVAKGCDRDYAVFLVTTAAGVVEALPGDRIERAANGELNVVQAHPVR